MTDLEKRDAYSRLLPQQKEASGITHRFFNDLVLLPNDRAGIDLYAGTPAILGMMGKVVINDVSYRLNPPPEAGIREFPALPVHCG